MEFCIKKYLDSARSLLAVSFFNSLLRSISGSSIAKLIGFGKEILIASIFGATGSLDIYLYNLTFIIVPVVIIMNGVQATFIAELPKTRNEKFFYTNTFLYNTIFILMIVIIWAIIGKSFLNINSNLDSVYFFVPYAILNSVQIILYGYLQHKREFLKNALIPCVTPAVVLLLYFFKDPDVYYILKLMMTGQLLEVLILFYYNSIDIKLIGFRKYNLKKYIFLLIKSKHIIAGFLIGAFVPMIEGMILTGNREGELSILSYSNKVPSAISSVVVACLGTVALPYFSGKDLKFIIQKVRVHIKVLFFLGLSILLFSVILFFISPLLVDFIFSNKALSVVDLSNIAIVQSVYFLHIPVQCLLMILSRILIAIELSRIIMLTMIISYLLQLSVYYNFKNSLSAEGIASISLTISIINVLVIFVLYFFLRKKRS